MPHLGARALHAGAAYLGKAENAARGHAEAAHRHFRFPAARRALRAVGRQADTDGDELGFVNRREDAGPAADVFVE